LKFLLAALMEPKASGFQRILTGDESRFFFYYPRDLVWAASRGELPQRIKRKSDTEKCSVSLLWSVNRIDSFLDLPKGTTYNITSFIDALMLSLIENVWLQTRRKTLKGWFIHVDNARPHNLERAERCIEASRAERLLHPAYSPDRVRVTSSSLDISKENHLIIVMRAGGPFERDH
jgi:hypothetical protein